MYFYNARGATCKHQSISPNPAASCDQCKRMDADGVNARSSCLCESDQGVRPVDIGREWDSFKGKRTHGGVICRGIHVKQGLGQSHVVENAKLFDPWRCRIISDPIRNGRESGRWTRMMECQYKKMLISIRFDRERNLTCFSTKRSHHCDIILNRMEVLCKMRIVHEKSVDGFPEGMYVTKRCTITCSGAPQTESGFGFPRATHGRRQPTVEVQPMVSIAVANLEMEKSFPGKTTIVLSSTEAIR